MFCVNSIENKTSEYIGCPCQRMCTELLETPFQLAWRFLRLILRLESFSNAVFIYGHR